MNDKNPSTGSLSRDPSNSRANSSTHFGVAAELICDDGGVCMATETENSEAGNSLNSPAGHQHESTHTNDSSNSGDNSASILAKGHNMQKAAEIGPLDGVDLPAIEDAVRTILRAIGEDPERPGLLETPRRVAKMYAEMSSGLRLEPERHLRVTFPETYDEVVLVRDISFSSICEHHLLPFFGHAHVAYIPNGRVTGLSKLARVVEEVARRPQVQERMTQTIAEMIETELETAGTAVVIQAEHTCMSIRGVRKPGSSTVTSALRGVFKDNAASRSEILSLISPK